MNIKRFNTNFRQTGSSIKAARQTQIYSHINRNIPQRIYMFTKDKFKKHFDKIPKWDKFHLIHKNPPIT